MNGYGWMDKWMGGCRWMGGWVCGWMDVNGLMGQGGMDSW